MKILHTADIHIRQKDDPRWNAFKQLLEAGTELEIDVMVISGDLFESTADAHRLRPRLRELFTDVAWPVVIIPGNHDAEAYPDGTFLGEQVTVLNDLLSPLRIGEAVFWGFPYEELPEEEVLEFLHLAASRIDPDSKETHILLFHGELLDITSTWDDYGDEGRQRYLPIKLSYLQHLPWRYVLAGHLHSRFDVHEFREDAYFVYPGSPISITKKETGIRKANLLELGKPPMAIPLQTPYYFELEIRLDPFQNRNPMLEIAERLNGLPENARVLLDISGFYNGRLLDLTEQELHRAINKILGDRIELLSMTFQDIREVLDDDLFRIFLERLQTRQVSKSEKEQILNVALRAMMEARA